MSKKKPIKQSAKPLQKIRQTCKCIYKSKMQTNTQINRHTIAQCRCGHTIQNAEMKQAKKLQHSFCNWSCKKVRNKTQKKRKAKYSCRLNIYQKSYTEHLCKSAKFVHACAWKPGQRSLRHFLANCQDASSANRIF